LKIPFMVAKVFLIKIAIKNAWFFFHAWRLPISTNRKGILRVWKTYQKVFKLKFYFSRSKSNIEWNYFMSQNLLLDMILDPLQLVPKYNMVTHYPTWKGMWRIHPLPIFTNLMCSSCIIGKCGKCFKVQQLEIGTNQGLGLKC
jgi:hypothetical protein